MATWPAAPFPQAPEPAGYSNVEADNVIRSPMGYGPAKLRQRTSQAIRNVKMSFFLDATDTATLDAFYITTLSRVDSFTWIDHRDNSAATYRFVSPPAYTPFGSASYWDIQLDLEIIG